MGVGEWGGRGFPSRTTRKIGYTYDTSVDLILMNAVNIYGMGIVHPWVGQNLLKCNDFRLLGLVGIRRRRAV